MEIGAAQDQSRAASPQSWDGATFVGPQDAVGDELVTHDEARISGTEIVWTQVIDHESPDMLRLNPGDYVGKRTQGEGCVLRSGSEFFCPGLGGAFLVSDDGTSATLKRDGFRDKIFSRQ